MEMPRSPARSKVTLGRTNGASARLASSGPPSTRVKDRSASSVDDRATTILPPPKPVCTPGSTRSGSAVAPSLKRQRPTLVASSTGLAVKSSVWPTTAAMSRTWRSGGVSGTLEATSRRAPS